MLEALVLAAQLSTAAPLPIERGAVQVPHTKEDSLRRYTMPAYADSVQRNSRYPQELAGYLDRVLWLWLLTK